MTPENHDIEMKIPLPEEWQAVMLKSNRPVYVLAGPVYKTPEGAPWIKAECCFAFDDIGRARRCLRKLCGMEDYSGGILYGEMYPATMWAKEISK